TNSDARGRFIGTRRSGAAARMSSLEAPNGSAAARCPFAFQCPSFGNSRRSLAFAYLGKSSRSLHIRRPLPDKEAPAHRVKKWGAEVTRKSERQLHSLMLSGLLDTKLFQSVEYPLGK